MKLFSSGAHDHLTADAHPNVWAGHSERDQMRADTDMFRRGAPARALTYHYRPRPEFDRPLTNPANPILASLRGRVKFQSDVHHPSASPRIAQTMLATLDKRWPFVQPATPEQIEHARAVLTRLANLITTKEH